MQKVAIVGFDECYASSVTAVGDVFRVANQLLAREQPKAKPLFECTFVSATGRSVQASSGVKLAVDGELPAKADVVFLPAIHYTGDDALVQRIGKIGIRSWLQSMAKKGALMAGGCSGAFLLADAGLLHGRTATTSWFIAGLFRRMYPDVDLKADELLAEDGQVITAGPVNAHFNLALRIVERIAGASTALLCAKVMLVDANRTSQLPYVVLQTQVGHTDDLVLRAETWMRRHLRDDFTLDRVASAVGSSERNLIRRFKRARNTTPLDYLQELRVESAKHLLETTSLGIDAIVTRVGYRDRGSFARLFRERTSLSPREYRERFQL